MRLEAIRENVKRILEELPKGVELEAAAKTRGPEEIRKAIEAGVKIIGENYVQEAREAIACLGHIAKWHFIGHLQKNKIRTAIQIFDMIETVDSVSLAEEIDKRSWELGKVMPILIEINSGRENQKFGVFPEKAQELIEQIAHLSNIKILGLMTMGPLSQEPENSRPYFIETKKAFDALKKVAMQNVKMKYLSMGMTNSYKVAIEEGANIVRIGTKIFGERTADC